MRWATSRTGRSAGDCEAGHSASALHHPPRPSRLAGASGDVRIECGRCRCGVRRARRDTSSLVARPRPRHGLHGWCGCRQDAADQGSAAEEWMGQPLSTPPPPAARREAPEASTGWEGEARMEATRWKHHHVYIRIVGADERGSEHHMGC